MKPRTLKIMCAGLTVASLAFDLYLLTTGQVDPNRYMPFVYPTALGIFFFLIRWIEKVDKMSPAEYVAYSSRFTRGDGSLRNHIADPGPRQD